MKSINGFTLAELLIALMILAEIATFTIPKVISATANGQNKSISKETASMVAGAFSNYQLKIGMASTMKGSDLTQYMNYIKVDTTTLYNATTGTALQQCTATLPCLTLHTGGVLQYDTAMTMGGTNTTNAVYFNLDPDGNGAQGRITFVQFYNGRLSSGGVAGTATPSGGTITREATDPTYFAW
jgi:prepilin-type N-terminal cleavage/methylation domain-containing protein